MTKRLKTSQTSPKHSPKNVSLLNRQDSRLSVLDAEQKSSDLKYQADLQSVNTKEAQRKKSEELKLKRETLEREYQKAEEAHNVGKAKQLSQSIASVEVQEYETSVMGTRVEPAMKEAEIKNIREKRGRELERFTAEEDKKTIQKQAELILAKQQREEDVAKIQMQAAAHAAGAKGLAPQEKNRRKIALQQAEATYGKEASDVAVAKGVTEKIRETIDPATLQELLRALQEIGPTVTGVFKEMTTVVREQNNQIKQQASQLKNGDFRTK